MTAPLAFLLLTTACLAVAPWTHATLADRWKAYSKRSDTWLPWLITALALVDVARLSQSHSIAIPALSALAGWAVPGALEQAWRRHSSDVHRLALLLAMAGLLAHGFADGALIRADSDPYHLLPMAIALHSLPVGVAIWWLIRPQMGRRLAVFAIGSVCLSMLAGFVSGASLHDHAGEGLWVLFEAFVAGSLIHVAFGKPHLDHDS